MLYRLADRLLLLKWLSYQGVPLLGHLRISNQQKKVLFDFPHSMLLSSLEKFTMFTCPVFD